jgi:hypothetical protein
MRPVSRAGQDVEGPHDAVVVGAGIVGRLDAATP